MKLGFETRESATQIGNDSHLPMGWRWVELERVCDINPSKPQRDALPPDAQVTFVPMLAVDDKTGTITAPRVGAFGELRGKYTAFRDGDVIVAKITPCMENGKAAIARRLQNGLGFGSSEFHVLRPTGALLPEYIHHFVRQERFRRAAESQMTGSVGQKRVPRAFLESIHLPLPPLAEQTRIVAKIEELLARVNSAREHLDRVPAILKRFRQAVLDAACSGRLTADWREGRGESAPNTGIQNTDEAPSSWKSAPLVELAKFIDYRGRTPQKVESGVPLITAKNIRQGYVDREPREFMREKDYDSWMTRGIPRLGDVLITTEAPLGYVATVDVSEKFALAQRVICLQFHDQRNQAFARLYMMSPVFQAMLLDQSTGTTVSGIKASRLKQLHLLLPPLPEQQEIVRRVEGLFAVAEQIEARLEKTRAQVEKLTPSILNKAFHGELVPAEAELAELDGRDYESAAALLERIHSIKSERSSKSGLQKRIAKAAPIKSARLLRLKRETAKTKQ